MSSVLEAIAVIKARDETGAAFAGVAKHIDAMNKAVKKSASLEAMVKSLEQVRGQLKAIDNFKTAQKGLGETTTAYKAATQNLHKFKEELSAVDKPSKAMTAQMRILEQESARTAEAFKRKGAAVRQATFYLGEAGVPINKLAAEQARLRSAVDSTTKSIQHQIAVEHQAASAHLQAEKAAERRAEGIRHHGFGRFVAGAAAGAVGVHGVLRFAESGIESGVERQHVIAGMKNAGMPPDEITRAQGLAAQITKTTPNLSVTELLELHKEARSAVQHPEETFNLMPDLAKATSVLKGMGAENANVADLVKAGESLGLMGDPKRFHAFLSGQVRAMAVMGKTIDTTQIYEAAKYSKSAGATLSDDFLNLTMPSLIQEMHGSSTGDALSSLTKRWRGGLNHQHLAVQRLQQIGMLEDPSQIKRSKTGEILGYGGKLVGDGLLGSDSGKFFQDVLNPKMEAAGIKTLSDKVKFLNETLPPVAANVGRILIQQEETLRQHRANYENAPGLDQALENQKGDAGVAVKGLTAALNDLGAAASEAALGPAAKGIGMLSGALKGLAAVAGDHPNIAAGVAAGGVAGGLYGAGYMAYAISTGFGLGASATALDGSAAMLSEAAVALGAKGGIPGAVVKGGAAAALGEAAAGAGGGAAGIGLPALAAGGGLLTMIAGGAYVIKASADAQQPGGGGMWSPATSPTQSDDQARLADMQQQLAGIDNQIAGINARSRDPSTFNPTLGPLQDRHDDLANEIAALSASLRALAPPLPGKLPMLPSGMTMGGGTPPPVDVTGKVQLEGQATVGITVKVDGPGQVTNQTSNASGNIRVGTSMPGAARASNSLYSAYDR